MTGFNSTPARYVEHVAKRRKEEAEQGVKNTVVQIQRKEDRTWLDYSRATEGQVQAFLTITSDRTRNWRAVDWLTGYVVHEPTLTRIVDVEDMKPNALATCPVCQDDVELHEWLEFLRTDGTVVGCDRS